MDVQADMVVLGWILEMSFACFQCVHDESAAASCDFRWPVG